MGLVDDQHLVLREDRRALDGVDREQRVIGDDDLGQLGALTGHLCEALRSVGTFGGAQALSGRNGHLGPRAVGDSGREVVAVAGLGLVRPVPQPQQVLAQLAEVGAAASNWSKRPSSSSCGTPSCSRCRHR